MTLITKLIIIFLALIGGTTLMISLFDASFLDHNFWNKHGIFFLLFITIFPRLTLLFSSIPFGGIFWWLGFFFAPRFLIALLATITYWNQNPLLVVISWLVCLSGESSEKIIVNNKIKSQKHKFQGKTFEADFKEI